MRTKLNKLYVYKGKKTEAVSFYLKSSIAATTLKYLLESFGFEVYSRAHNGDHEVRVSYKKRVRQ